MSDYRVPRQRAVEIGEHMDGVGVILDPDNGDHAAFSLTKHVDIC